MATLLNPAVSLASSSQFLGQSLKPTSSSVSTQASSSPLFIRAGPYTDELIKTAKSIASPGRGILAMDESNATCGKRLASIGLENTEVNRQAYRQLLLTTPGLGENISGAILFEETLYQSTVDGKKFVDCLKDSAGICPGIKVDKGLVPLAGSNDESWCQGLDGLASRSAEYFKQGARFAKWRTVVSIPNGPSELAVQEAAWGLARYAAISQMHLSRSCSRLCTSRELEKLLRKSLRKKMGLPTSWCSDALLASFISFPALLSFTDSAHAESSKREVNQIYGGLSAGLDVGVQVLYLAALLSLVGVASFFVVKQVLIRRELESAARDLQDRVRTGEALPVEYFELGAVMLRKKFYMLASKYLEQAINKWDGDPQDLAQVHNALGFSLVSDGKIDKGISEYQKAVKLQPGYVVAWNNLGSAYEKKKNLPKALEAYEQALLFDPNNAVAREYRDALKKRVELRAGIPVKYD